MGICAGAARTPPSSRQSSALPRRFRRDTDMSAIEEKTVETIDIFGATLTRSKFVKGTGGMVVGLSMVGAGFGAKTATAASTPDVPLLPGTAHSPNTGVSDTRFTITDDNTTTSRTLIDEMVNSLSF